MAVSEEGILNSHAAHNNVSGKGGPHAVVAPCEIIMELKNSCCFGDFVAVVMSQVAQHITHVFVVMLV